MKYFIALDTKDYTLKKGITPVSLTWKYQTISDWTRGLNFTNIDIVIGHSLGAAVALIVSEKTPPKELHLYSPSPFFTETLHLLDKQDLKYIGKKRLKEMKSLPRVTCPIFLYIGVDEDPRMILNGLRLWYNMANIKLIFCAGNHQTVIHNGILA